MISEKKVFGNVGDETIYKTVNYNEITPVLIEAVKELKQEIDELRQEIETLKNN